MGIIEKLNTVLVNKAFAASLGSQIGSTATDFSGVTDEDTFTEKIIEIAVPLSIGCAVILLVYGGYMMMSSQGNPDKLQEARSIVTNAVIGLLVILLSVSILLIISNGLGLNIYT